MLRHFVLSMRHDDTGGGVVQPVVKPLPPQQHAAADLLVVLRFHALSERVEPA